MSDAAARPVAGTTDAGAGPVPLPPPADRLPRAVRDYLGSVLDATRVAYGADLAGVYLHGSAAFGHFVSRASDLDLLIVLRRDPGAPDPPDDPGEQGAPDPHLALYDRLVALDRPAAVLGLELSVLLRRDLRAGGTTPPFLAHVNLGPPGPRYVPGAGHPGDPDLVLHRAVVRAAGLALVGPAPGALFPPVPRPDLLHVLSGELAWAEEEGDFAYAVLNAARAWRYTHDEALVSKLDGWLWARSRVDDPSVLDAATAAYLTARDLHRAPPPALPDFAVGALAFLEDVRARLRAASPPSPE